MPWSNYNEFTFDWIRWNGRNCFFHVWRYNSLGYLSTFLHAIFFFEGITATIYRVKEKITYVQVSWKVSQICSNTYAQIILLGIGYIRYTRAQYQHFQPPAFFQSTGTQHKCDSLLDFTLQTFFYLRSGALTSLTSHPYIVYFVFKNIPFDFGGAIYLVPFISPLFSSDIAHLIRSLEGWTQNNIDDVKPSLRSYAASSNLR